MVRWIRIGAGLATAVVTFSLVASDASAASARHISGKGRHASVHRPQVARHVARAADDAAGRAFAGTALGLIGAAAGAAIAGHEEDDGYGYGYGGADYPYGGPGFTYGGYPPAPFAYGGYGYGIQVY